MEQAYEESVRPRFPGEVEPTPEATLAMSAEEQESLVPLYVELVVETIRTNQELKKINDYLARKKAEGKELIEQGFSEEEVEKMMFEMENLGSVVQAQRDLQEYMECLGTKIGDLAQQMRWLGIEEPDTCPGDEFLDGEEDDPDWVGHYM